MKYMGSKNALLANGLGRVIVEEAKQANRIVDLFCGSGAISWFAAERTVLPVLAIDLQEYAVVMARSVIGRTSSLEPDDIEQAWLRSVIRLRESSDAWSEGRELEHRHQSIAEMVRASRTLCGTTRGSGMIWQSYGGHYYSPSQAVTLDLMIKTLPEVEPMRTVCLAATISTGSQCAASPGHTAQPFQPTPGASPFLAEAWARDPMGAARKALKQICSRRAAVVGQANVGDAVEVSSTLRSSDLVIVDPPYSGVQYSRFYHVLETIARRKPQRVVGTGRYPPLELRPQSAFSRPSESRQALDTLLARLSRSGSTVIFTFPVGESSNGLSGDIITRMSDHLFDVEQEKIYSRLSTLGGNNTNRRARSELHELVLVLRSKARPRGQVDGVSVGPGVAAGASRNRGQRADRGAGDQ